jgi:EAL domain-containing protein (putative c-di-GMP-specific phosphodiesterase class I)
VNVSARQFLQTDFVAKLQALLAFTEADPSRLTLEVTEGLVLGDLMRLRTGCCSCAKWASSLRWMILAPAIRPWPI